MVVWNETAEMDWKGEWKRNAEGERQEDRMDLSEDVITGMNPFLGIKVEWIPFFGNFWDGSLNVGTDNYIYGMEGPQGRMEASDGRGMPKGTRDRGREVGPNT